MNHTLSGADNGTFSSDECLSDDSDISRVTGSPDHFYRCILKFSIVKFFIQDIDRYFEQHRTGTTCSEIRKGAPHHLRYAVGEVNRIRPFSDTLIVFRGNKTRGTELASFRAARYYQNRDGLTISLCDAGISIFDARAGLHQT